MLLKIKKSKPKPKLNLTIIETTTSISNKRIFFALSTEIKETMITYEQYTWLCTIEQRIDILHRLVKIFRFYKGDIRYEPVYYPPPRPLSSICRPFLSNYSSSFDKEFENSFKQLPYSWDERLHFSFLFKFIIITNVVDCLWIPRYLNFESK